MYCCISSWQSLRVSFFLLVWACSALFAPRCFCRVWLTWQRGLPPGGGLLLDPTEVLLFIRAGQGGPDPQHRGGFKGRRGVGVLDARVNGIKDTSFRIVIILYIIMKELYIITHETATSSSSRAVIVLYTFRRKRAVYDIIMVFIHKYYERSTTSGISLAPPVPWWPLYWWPPSPSLQVILTTVWLQVTYPAPFVEPTNGT